ncbi:fatty acyl-CoA reductase wat [Orussus abietinus]|uniref:fatty acyl-CoA reductase wat n=1 Tax=Orussus abietinus TaxID=222816 RepID=UPI000C71629E|nr:fatty acyl-CoA reductase wat [Orussus abietinus]XP_023288184.1 fatty acyl-CoA reductase wat [Orussus abietinus]
MTVRGSQLYLQDMFDEPADPADEVSEIAEFFAGCNVLVTGGSGFLGELLIEKLLRSCTGIKNLYMLLRSKKGKSPEVRFKELFDNVLFDRLKKEQPNFVQKVIIVEGDVGEESLGLSEENRELLLNSNIIFHGAATVRFDEKIRLATNINVRGTKQLLLLAREMQNLKAFVHISTAFSQCVVKFIDEIYYKPPIEGDKLLTLLDVLDDDVLDHMTPALLGKWPNTYAFTKAVAEDTVRRYGKGLPVCIVRPSIIISTSKEPISGWINNINGATAVSVGAGVGLLRTIHCDKDKVADIIPGDYVINNIIAAAWGAGRAEDINLNIDTLSELNEEKTDEPPIYNVVSSCQAPITWDEYMNKNKFYCKRIPSMKYLWYFGFTFHKNLWMHKIYILFLHLIPALIVDSLAYVSGRKPILWNTYKKIHKLIAVVSYFTTQQWTFRNRRVQKLWERLRPADRKKFFFSIEEINWDEYWCPYVRGIRLHILKDPLDTLDMARIKYRKLTIAHYTISTVAVLLLAWALIAIVRCVTGW